MTQLRSWATLAGVILALGLWGPPRRRIPP